MNNYLDADIFAAMPSSNFNFTENTDAAGPQPQSEATSEVGEIDTGFDLFASINQVAQNLTE